MSNKENHLKKINRKIDIRRERILGIDKILRKDRFGYARRRKYKDEKQILIEEIKKLQEEMSHLELLSKTGK